MNSNNFKINSNHRRGISCVKVAVSDSYQQAYFLQRFAADTAAGIMPTGGISSAAKAIAIFLNMGRSSRTV